MAKPLPDKKAEALALYLSDAGLSMIDIADRIDAKAGVIKAWATEGRWKEKRDEHFRSVAQQIEKTSIEQRVSELVEWNDRDLILAKEIRRQAATLIQRMREMPTGLKYVSTHVMNLRTIAQVLELTQRIARTAIGIGHKGVGDYTPGEIEDDQTITSVTVNIRSARMRPDGAELELVGEYDGTGDDMGDGRDLVPT
jgi:hypothetical protein